MSGPAPSGPSARPRATRDYAGWVQRGLVTLAFIGIGWGKFDTNPHGEWVRIFARIGIGQWFRYFTGIVEVAGGLLYLPPRTCRIGAVLLASAMIGAVFALCTVLASPVSSIVPLALLVAVVLIALRVPESDSLHNRWRVRPLTTRQH